jgi:hypothetical protein
MSYTLDRSLGWGSGGTNGRHGQSKKGRETHFDSERIWGVVFQALFRWNNVYNIKVSARNHANGD